MSLRLALQVVGGLVIGYLLFAALVAMGPIGWLAFVPLLAIGLVEVYRNRVRHDGTAGPPDYCPNCGSAAEYGAVDGESADDHWEARYCPDCGAPLHPEREPDRDEDTTDADGLERPTNCPDCGAPNDPDRTT